MKKRLLIFHPALAPYRLDLFNRLNQIFDLHVVFTERNVPYQDYDQTRLLSELESDYSFLDKGFKVLGRQVRFGAARIVRDFQPDTIVTSEFSLLTLQIASGNFEGNPRCVVWTADNPEIVAGEKATRSLMRRLILSRVDGIIVYSTAIKKYYQDHFQNLPQIGISPNAQSETVLRQKLQEALGRADQLQQQHDLTDRKILLYVGRLATVKRIDRLLKVFAVLLADDPELRLVLVGDGPDHPELVQLSNELGLTQKTIFAGHCEGNDLYAWFNLGSVFVLPSEFEPWGAVVNEALIAGLPVVCSKDVGARELIEVGYNGTVVDADNKSLFAATLTEWLCHVPTRQSGSRKLREMLQRKPFAEAVAGFADVVSGTNSS